VLMLNGAGTTLRDTGTDGSLQIGGGGSGQVTVTNGAGVTDAAVDTLGAAAGGAGELDVSAGGNFSNEGLMVGDAGLGSLAITAGGTVSAASLDSGVRSGSDANIVVTGTASVLTITGQLTIGDRSSADLSITGGATVTAGNAAIGLNAGVGTPAQPGGAGVIDLAGVGSELSITNTLTIGDGGTGALVMGADTTLHVANSLVIGASGALQQFGGTIDPSSFTNNSANAVGGGGGVLEVGTTLTNDGVYTVGSGTFTIDAGTPDTVGDITTYVGGTLTGIGSFLIGTKGFAGDLLLNAGTVSGTQTVEFNPQSTSEVLTIGTLGGFAAVIGSFDPTAEIILAGTSIASDSYSDGTLTLFGAGGAELGTLTIGSGVDPSLLTVNAAGGIGEAPCFAAGTRIATARGEIAVEAIGVGERVQVLLGDGFSEVIWVGRREVDCARHPQPRKVWPVRIAAGAFGPNRPGKELFLSPDHAVYVEDVLIPIKHLINGRTIVQVPLRHVTYHHLELAAHDVLLAEGLPAESFLDMRDGSNYANRPGPTRLYPDFSARMWEAFGCARLVVTGPEFSAARALVGSFAAEQKAA
jgi:T5SS/PEP-CTERM-associated repeat protein